MFGTFGVHSEHLQTVVGNKLEMKSDTCACFADGLCINILARTCRNVCHLWSPCCP